MNAPGVVQHWRMRFQIKYPILSSDFLLREVSRPDYDLNYLGYLGA